MIANKLSPTCYRTDRVLSRRSSPLVSFSLKAILQRIRDYMDRRESSKIGDPAASIRDKLSSTPELGHDHYAWGEIIALAMEGAIRTGASWDDIACAITAAQGRIERRTFHAHIHAREAPVATKPIASAETFVMKVMGHARLRPRDLANLLTVSLLCEDLGRNTITLAGDSAARLVELGVLHTAGEGVYALTVFGRHVAMNFFGEMPDPLLKTGRDIRAERNLRRHRHLEAIEHLRRMEQD